MGTSLLEMRNISKVFPGVKALDDVSIYVNRHEILALLGENGAGKSTLMKVLSGVHQPDSGRIFINGEVCVIKNPKHSQDLGVSIIYQELNSIQNMSIAENIFLGREPYKFKKIIDRKNLYSNAEKLLKKVGLVNLSPYKKIIDLTIAEQQLVEIAKALSVDAKIIIMDEPTATLNEEDTQKLLNIMKELREEGLGIIFITHKLDEVMQVADRIAVLRDGIYIGSKDIKEVDIESMVSMMVGRELNSLYPEIKLSTEDVILKVGNLSLDNRLFDINFTVKSGEVLGIAGLLGSGRTELSKALFGYYSDTKGSIEINNQSIKTTREAIKSGIALITDDRKHEGLILGMSVYENLLLPVYSSISKFGVQRKNIKNQIVEKWIKALKIKVHNSSVLVGTLSGGNQQKVVLGKWLQMEPKVLILNEPTRGIDIGAKSEIYNIINDLAAQGVAVIVISSEMPELLGLSHRVLVMADGKVTADLPRNEATQEKIFHYASGGGLNNEFITIN